MAGCRCDGRAAAGSGSGSTSTSSVNARLARYRSAHVSARLQRGESAMSAHRRRPRAPARAPGAQRTVNQAATDSQPTSNRLDKRLTDGLSLVRAEARSRWRFLAGAKAWGGHWPLQIVARPPNLAVLLTYCGQLILRKIIKFDATRCQILRQNSISAPDPAAGA